MKSAGKTIYEGYIYVSIHISAETEMKYKLTLAERDAIAVSIHISAETEMKCFDTVAFDPGLPEFQSTSPPKRR